MDLRVLIEASNLTLRSGTGIATYARTLAEACRSLGCSPAALVGVDHSLTKNEPQLNEILAFDSRPDNWREGIVEGALRVLKYPFSGLLGLHATKLEVRGTVIGQNVGNLSLFDGVDAIPRLVDQVTAHFKIYGKLARIQPSHLPDLFHVTHPLPVAVNKSLNIYTIHDLVPLRLPFTTLDNKKFFYRLLKRIAREADHIVTVSEHSRQDIIDVLGVEEKRVSNTFQAVSFPAHLCTRPDDEVAAELRDQFGLEAKQYFLFYGALEPKKNLTRLVQAYAASGTVKPLIIVGGNGWLNSGDLRQISHERFQSFRFDGKSFRKERRVRRINYVPTDQLVSLIKGARAVLFPSIYEGFGLPVAEAMLLGTPVMTSNISSLPEIAGDSALLVDPYNVASIANAIRLLDVDADLCEDLSTRGIARAQLFSPEVYLDRVRSLYKSVLKMGDTR